MNWAVRLEQFVTEYTMLIMVCKSMIDLVDENEVANKINHFFIGTIEEIVEVIPAETCSMVWKECDKMVSECG